MNINLNATFNNSNSDPYRLSYADKVLALNSHDPLPGVKAFSSYSSQPGEVVYCTKGRSISVSTVRNTPQERKQIRDAIASHMPRYVMWTGYIGDVNKMMGVKHYWEIPSERIPEALTVIENMFKQFAPLLQSYSQEPVASESAVNANSLNEARWELEAALNQFESYKAWFTEQMSLMSYAADSIRNTLNSLK